MGDVRQILKDIEEKSNSIVAKLEMLHMGEDNADSIKKELKTIKKKLEDDEITKFSYGKMLEANKKKAEENKEEKKKAWDEVAQTVNEISDKLNELKEMYNKKTKSEKASEMVEEEIEEKKDTKKESKGKEEEDKSKDITLEERKK